jgi:hypothetical protein
MRVFLYCVLRDLALWIRGYRQVGGGVDGDYISIYARKR